MTCPRCGYRKRVKLRRDGTGWKATYPGSAIAIRFEATSWSAAVAYIHSAGFAGQISVWRLFDTGGES